MMLRSSWQRGGLGDRRSYRWQVECLVSTLSADGVQAAHGKLRPSKVLHMADTKRVSTRGQLHLASVWHRCRAHLGWTNSEASDGLRP